MLDSGLLVTVPFPFSDKEKSKPRPVLVISKSDAYGDFICLAVTSREREANAVCLTRDDMLDGDLPVSSWVRTDKIFTLNGALVIRVLGMVQAQVVGEALSQLCKKVGYTP